MQESKCSYLLPLPLVQHLPGKSLLVEPGQGEAAPRVSIWLPGLRSTPAHDRLSLTDCSIKGSSERFPLNFIPGDANKSVGSKALIFLPLGKIKKRRQTSFCCFCFPSAECGGWHGERWRWGRDALWKRTDPSVLFQPL